jgi:hypothetical protein
VGPRAVGADVDDRVEELATELAVTHDDVADTTLGQCSEDARRPGDVPHTWIGAEYILAFRSMLAYERAADRSLVLAAGVPASWLDAGAVGVTGLPTYYGTLDLRLHRDSAGTLDLSQ